MIRRSFFLPLLSIVFILLSILTTSYLVSQRHSSFDNPLYAVTEPMIFGANIVGSNININQIRAANLTETTFWIYLPDYVNPVTKKLMPSKLLQDINVYSTLRGGLKVRVHVMPQTREEAAQLKGFYMPDLTIYLPLLQELVNTLKGKVKYYSFSNEASFLWVDTNENYGQFLARSFETVKATDTNAIVLDSGMSSETMGILLTNSLYRQGNIQGAIDFINGYFRYHKLGILEQILPVEGETELINILNSSQATKIIDFGQMMFQEFCPKYDIFQAHFYQEWSYLEKVIDWVKLQMTANNCIKPFQFWELGYGFDNVDEYDVNDHARAIPKYLAIAASAGNFIDYSTFYEKHAFMRGLYNANGSLKPTATSFNVSTSELKDFTYSSKLNLGENIWAYRFIKPGKEVYVVWSASPQTIKWPTRSSSPKTLVTIDINGITHTISPPFNISASDSPLFVEITY